MKFKEYLCFWVAGMKWMLLVSSIILGLATPVLFFVILLAPNFKDVDGNKIPLGVSLSTFFTCLIFYGIYRIFKYIDYKLKS